VTQSLGPTSPTAPEPRPVPAQDPYEPELGSLPDASDRDEESVNKTGTTTIGITTTDGVVVATDQRASLGGRFVSNKNVQKVEQIHLTAAPDAGGQRRRRPVVHPHAPEPRSTSTRPAVVRT